MKEDRGGLSAMKRNLISSKLVRHSGNAEGRTRAAMESVESMVDTVRPDKLALPLVLAQLPKLKRMRWGST